MLNFGILSPLLKQKLSPKAAKAKAERDLAYAKSDDIEPRLEDFKKDYEGYKNRTAPFKVYK